MLISQNFFENFDFKNQENKINFLKKKIKNLQKFLSFRHFNKTSKIQNYLLKKKIFISIFSKNNK